ncbi:MAG: NAD(P)/FAD-dependent oxidoreductase, partial [Rhodospirillaceae bacterium]|nr:NAD(P)/FAD-dependent oxidoreductase [Rhodospirillaceae bacterium]
MKTFDNIIIGSGINGLVAASVLAKKGRKVLLLERNEQIGGCIRSDEATEPGFVHDVMATTFVLFITSPAYAVLADDLHARGLEFCQPEFPSGVLMDDGRSCVISMNADDNRARLNALSPGDGDRMRENVGEIGANAELIFALLGSELWSLATAKLLAKAAWKMGPHALTRFFGRGLDTARRWLETEYKSEVSQALWAPWVLHTGLGPESTYSGQMGRVIAFALEAAGAPIVKGGAKNILTAFEKLITDFGGEIRTGADVERIIVKNAKAIGVRLSDGEEIGVSRSVIASVAPKALYQNLLAGSGIDSTVVEEAKSYRYGKGDMQIHYSLHGKPQWANEELSKVALLHLSDGIDSVSKASNEAERGMIPENPTVCVGQPTSFDPSRCPEGKSILWLQLPEVPRHVKGDAAGKINIPADGKWTSELKEAYADRIEARLRKHIKNFDEIKGVRTSYSPGDLEAMNVNLVGGDPYGGYCGIDQFFVWRPLG